MKIARRFTQAGTSPYDTTEWVHRTSRITNPDGSVVFEMTDAEVPTGWSQLATDIMVSKYFRKAGVPQVDSDGSPVLDSEGEAVLGPERSAKQVIGRLAGCWRHWGEEHGYFDSGDDAQAFEDELAYMLVHQMAAPNSPQWFNTGLHHAYGINGPAQGHFYADARTGEVRASEDAYTHPQPHACFIQSVDDDLVNPGGIMDLWTREARLFKYGSGTGTNFSRLRAEGELLSGGGKSSGLMSWLKIGDRAAGAIKSGGTTRRAAKMVCLDLDHPDIEAFIDWKAREELKVAALVEGCRAFAGAHREEADRLGLSLEYDFNGEAYQTVSGQNANNSVRIPDSFFRALDAGESWSLTARTTGEVVKELDAAALWSRIGRAAWRCADPGVQYDSTINAWHTCPGSGRINASNPCSEYMFLDNTACNLASLNLLKFYDAGARSFDVEGYEHAIDLWTVVLEISVLMAQYPSEEIARLSYCYRTLGLGYANIGAMLMQAGIAYDSDEARSVCGMLTAILTGRSYRVSAAMAREHGPFAGFHRDGNRESMLRVIRNHRRAAHGVERESGEWEGLEIRPVPIDHGLVKSGGVRLANARSLLSHAVSAWDDALTMGERYGFRNAQVTVIAPTGTIGLLMDCDTTGVEPDFALVKFKKLAGGGYFKIANNSLRPALVALGYASGDVDAIVRYVLGALTLDVPVPASDGTPAEGGESLRSWLVGKGLTEEELASVETSLPGVFELRYAFSAWSLGDGVLARLGIDADLAKSDPSFSVLAELGLTEAQVSSLNRVVCGTQTVEGAPHLAEGDLSVFDCANTCGELGTRSIHAEGHIRMMAAAQPFISGAISKTINLPNSATVEDIAGAYRLSWELGLKANALYRDGCKLSQPLSTKSESSSAVDAVLEDEPEDEESVEAAREEIVGEARRLALAADEGDEEQVQRVVERIVHRPMRRRLPDTRQSLTHKFNVSGHEGYLTVGLYEDGSPGELFITMSKEGSTIGGLMDSLGTATSVALQYGVPIESLVRKFTHQRFEPAGMTTNRDIPFAKSLVDYIFRWMGIQFIEGYLEQNGPRREREPGMPRVGGGLRPSESAPRGGGRLADGDAARRVVRHDLSTRGDRSPTASFGPASVGAVRGNTALRLITDADESDSSLSLGHAELKPGSSVDRRPVDGGAARDRELEVEPAQVDRDALSRSMAEFQEDAPACDVCGTITVRNGTCYRCMNCGNSMGCS